MVHQALLLLGTTALGHLLIWSVFIFVMEVRRDFLRRQHQLHRVPVGQMCLCLGLRPIILAHDLVVELLWRPIVVLESLTRSQVLHRRTRIDLNVERHDVSDSDFVPGVVLDDNVQVVPDVHDLSDH